MFYLISPDEETESSSDEDKILISILKIIKNNKEILSQTTFVEEINKYSDHDFKEMFRISRKTFDFILENYLTSILSKVGFKEKEILKIQLKNDLLFILLLLAKKHNSIKIISELFKTSEDEVNRGLSRIIKFVFDVEHKFISWPSKEEQSEISHEFKKITLVSGIVGILGTAVFKITNREESYSITLQVVVDHNMVLRFIEFGAKDEINRNDILVNSELYKLPSDYKIFSDNLIHVTSKNYTELNWLSSNSRNGCILDGVLTETFDLLKRRFGSLMNIGEEEGALNLLVTACVLHNICLLMGDNFDNPERLKQRNSLRDE